MTWKRKYIWVTFINPLWDLVTLVCLWRIIIKIKLFEWERMITLAKVKEFFPNIKKKYIEFFPLLEVIYI
jgi:hypothetical protein